MVYRYELTDTGEPAPEPEPEPLKQSRGGLTDSDEYDYQYSRPAPRSVPTPVKTPFARCSLVQRKEELVTSYSYYGTSSRSVRKRLFGRPMVLTVKNPITYQELYDSCVRKMSRFINTQAAGKPAVRPRIPPKPKPKPPTRPPPAVPLSYRPSRQGVSARNNHHDDQDDDDDRDEERGYGVIGGSDDDSSRVAGADPSSDEGGWTGDISPNRQLDDSTDSHHVKFQDDHELDDSDSHANGASITDSQEEAAVPTAGDDDAAADKAVSEDDKKDNDDDNDDDDDNDHNDHNDDDDDDDDNDEKSTEPQAEEEEAPAEIPWFELRVVDSYGTTDVRYLRPDDPPFYLYDKQTIAMCWNGDALDEIYESSAEDVRACSLSLSLNPLTLTVNPLA